MRAGELRHRVKIQTPASTAGAYGQDATAYVDGDTIRASVWPKAAADVAVAGQQQQTTTHEVRARYTAALTPGCRLVWRGKVLDVITAVDVDGRRVELRALCAEVVPNG